jgi:hypothetical protein
MSGPIRTPFHINIRVVVLSISALAIVFLLYNSKSSLAPLADPVLQKQVTDPHPSISSLQLSISEKSPPTLPPTLLVTVTNLHQSTSLSLLTWDTPFDEKALDLGIFEFIDVDAQRTLRTPELTINRGLPPPPEAFLEIGPREALTKEIILDSPVTKLEDGKEYDVQAKGRWKAVWHAGVSDIGDENLKKMGGGTGVKTWDFTSSMLRIKT